MSCWKWTNLDNVTDVARVPGGLLFRVSNLQESGNGLGVGEALCFVPCAAAEADAFISNPGGV